MRGSALLGVMTRLVPLVPGRHTSLYNATTRRLCQLQQLESVLVEDSKIVSEETAQSISSLQSVPLLTESSSSCPQYKAPLVTVNGIKFTPASGQKHPETIKQPSGRIGSDFRQIHSSTSAQSTVQELDNIYKRVHSQLDSNCNVTDLSQSPDVMTQSIVHASSKRARNMVLGSESKVAAPRMSAHSLLSTSNAAAKPKTKQLSLFDKVGQIKGGDRVPLVGSSAAVNGISKVHQLVCTVCKENVSDPHAARCGHICCIRCWKSWLKGSGKQSCPLCRKDVEYSQLTKIIIQNS